MDRSAHFNHDNHELVAHVSSGSDDSLISTNARKFTVLRMSETTIYMVSSRESRVTDDSDFCLTSKQFINKLLHVTDTVKITGSYITC